jgi:SAM-dependent methyltransferase
VTSADEQRLRAAIAAALDGAALDLLAERLAPARAERPDSAVKYLDRDYWLGRNLQRAARLGLDRGPARAVLDLGCGPGYFVAVCRRLGHRAVGADQPARRASDLERQVFPALNAALGVAPVELAIDAFAAPAAPAPGRFDLVTAFQVCFNRHKRDGEWSRAEWQFFVEHARGWLAPGGQLYFELNEHAARYGALRWYDADTLAWLRAVGEVDAHCVRIRAR